MTSFPQTILMCPPDHFEVVYVINPWMEGQFANTDDALVHRQWNDLRNAIEEADALEFCCNAVDLDGYVFMNDASENLKNRLRNAGFTPVITPLSEFMKAGGAAKCLTLKLVET